MSWIDYKKYSHFEQLEQLYRIGKIDYEKIVNIDIKKLSDNIVETYSHIPWPSNVDWHIHPLIKGGVINEMYNQYWQQTVNYAKNIPGLNSLNVNFVDPQSIIPDHCDDMPMLVDVENWRNELGYISIVGIDIPGNNLKETGFHVNHEKKLIKTGDIVTFNGSNLHGGWNFTDQRRVTFYVSINKKYYAIN